MFHRAKNQVQVKIKNLKNLVKKSIIPIPILTIADIASNHRLDKIS